MSLIRGIYYPSGRSERLDCTLKVDGDIGSTLSFIGEGGERFYSCDLQECQIEPALGSTPRKIHVPDGSIFETDAHSDIQRLEREHDHNSSATLRHKLEQFGPHLLAVFVASCAAVYLVGKYGLGLLVAAAIALTPPALLAQIDSNTLSIIDYTIAEPSKLTQAEQDDIRKIYDDIIATLPKEAQERYQLNLEFRSTESLGPNAFALPGGTMIITDQLATQFPDPNILASILGHETAHVTQNHGLKRIYRSLGTYILVAMIAGDTGPILDEILLEGQTFLSFSHSRDQERDADHVGVQRALDAGYNPEGLKQFFERFESDGNSGWLATHPSHSSRIADIDAFIAAHSAQQ